jgi:hypothetical protein
MRILPWHPIAREARSFRAVEAHLGPTPRRKLYFDIVERLARTESLDPVSAMRVLLRIAPTIDDPLELYGICEVWLDLIERLQRFELSEQTLDLAKRLVCLVEARELPAGVLQRVRQIRADVEEAWEAERHFLELEALTKDINARLARFDQMSSAEKARLERDIRTGDQRARVAARALAVGRGHSTRNPRGRRQRTPHHSGRRAPRRRVIRRAQSDSGGDGDDGPEPRCGRLACKGVRRLTHDSADAEHSRGANV